MARVDFYILDTPSPETLIRLACRLSEKVWKMGHRVYVATASAKATQRLDELLWSFRPDSFVPHGCYPEDSHKDFPILIGHNGATSSDGAVLINLTPSVPEFHERFARIVEFVPHDPQSRRHGM